ncbi:histidine phosphatase family protein [Salinispora arenicola]|uniref:histidine phosphatase family protein n=1 Tax=Salinispora arenicola TaxID=168697 RepID=UPI00143029BE|nr:histidine phosphatase family protein [Salinispora arenicola]NIL43763.1 histidine phosphatase family protein [Salinispora arenicola]
MTSPVLWIRHGASLDGILRPKAHARPDTPLTTRGANQIATTARELRDRGIRPAIVLTSPYPRATASAAILAELLGAPLAPPDPLYAEWRAPDCVLGKGADDYPAEYRAWRATRLGDPDSALPGGESLTALWRRALAASVAHEQYIDREGGATLIVSHRVLIGAVAAISINIRRPEDVFRAACAFPLGPAGVWSLPNLTPKAVLPRSKE